MALFRSVCAGVGVVSGKCPHLRPRSFQSIPGFELLQAGSLHTGRILVTGDSTGAVLLTTRPTREGKYLRSLEVRVSDLGIAHRREKWYLQIRFISSRLEVLEVSCGLRSGLRICLSYHDIRL
jgi:hypothetical protein